MAEALTDAAKRGADVKIIVPGTSDSHVARIAGEYSYSRLLKSGVKLYKRRNALLHSKTMVIDGIWSTVGSTNMDFWSFSINDEVNAVVLNAEFPVEMEKKFAMDLAESEEVMLGEWKKRPFFSKVKEWFYHLFSRWLCRTFAGEGASAGELDVASSGDSDAPSSNHARALTKRASRTFFPSMVSPTANGPNRTIARPLREPSSMTTRARNSAGGRKTTEEQFSHDRSMDRLLTLYDELIGAGSRRSSGTAAV